MDKQNVILITPIFLSILYSLVIFFSTIIGSDELSYLGKDLLYSQLSRYFFLVMTLNFIPAFLLSLLLWIYFINKPNDLNGGKFLLIMSLFGGFIPVFWFYCTYYFFNNHPITIILYGFPFIFFIGMITGFFIGITLLNFRSSSWKK